MSLETWKAEFYPASADKVPKADALAHSLRKWEGLRWKNRMRHGLRMLQEDMLGFSVYGDGFSVNAQTCALCQHHLLIDGDCGDCPLKQVLGKSCDSLDGPYTTFLNTGSPKPMIAALEAAAKLEAKK